MNCPALARVLLGLALAAGGGLVSCADLATSNGTPGVDAAEDFVGGATDTIAAGTDSNIFVDTASCDVGAPAIYDAASPAVQATAPADIEAKAGECDGKWEKVYYVIDGDTFALQDLTKVRLAGINAPEVIHSDCSGTADCGGYDAKLKLEAWLSYGTSVCLVKDKQNTDGFGRLVRYAYVALNQPVGGPKTVLLNGKMLQLGLVRVWDEYLKGLKHESAMKAQQAWAKTNKQGGWGSCSW